MERAVIDRVLIAPTGYLDFRRLSVLSEARMNEPGLFCVLPLRFVNNPKTLDLFGGKKRGNEREKRAVVDCHGQLVDVLFYGWNDLLARAMRDERSVFIWATPCYSRAEQSVSLRLVHTVDAGDVGKVFPVYRKDGPVDAALARELVTTAFQDESALRLALAGRLHCSSSEADSLCESVGFPFGFTTLLRAIHQPLSPEQATHAAATARQLSIAYLLWLAANRQRQERATARHVCEDAAIADAQRAVAGRTLTSDQTNAVRSLVDFLRSNRRRILVSGDVGTGKTAVFLGVVSAAIRGGVFRVAVMAPNALIARAIYAVAKSLRSEAEVALLTGDECSANVAEANLVIGTQALLHRKDRFEIVVVDEMHRFSTKQREALLSRDGKLIEATATCVPRTQALLTTGDNEVVRLRQRPYLGDVRTHRLDGSGGRAQITEMIRSALNDGSQIALIYPKVVSKRSANASGEDTSVATAAYERLRAKFGDVIGLIHGQLSEMEKQTAIAHMNDGTTQVLVSTTVIEMGITLPSLRLIVVVGPDRFGLSTLHQLRGRLARHGGDGDFVLHHEIDDIGDAASLRANALTSTNDGFEIAEIDLQLRGAGEIVNGHSQSGRTAFLFQNVEPSMAEVAAFVARRGCNDSIGRNNEVLNVS